MSTVPADVTALAQELYEARASGAGVVSAPSARDGGFSLDAAYAVEAELTRLRRTNGRTTVGRKVGYANKAVWRALKLQTLVWANMYDDTVQFAGGGEASLSVARMRAPRIEPEIVVRLKAVPASADPAAVLENVEWLALGFEIVDAPFPEWKFEPADFVASFGLHAALIVGEPRRVEPADIPALVDQLASFKVQLSRNGTLVEEGAGKNSLRSPALCVGELAAAIAGRPGAEPLRPGELLSTGTLTAAHPIAAGERWTVEADGLDLGPVALTVTGPN
jgi:2-oxo-3-hexenedioate decarboxylase